MLHLAPNRDMSSWRCGIGKTAHTRTYYGDRTTPRIDTSDPRRSDTSAQNASDRGADIIFRENKSKPQRSFLRYPPIPSTTELAPKSVTTQLNDHRDKTLISLRNSVWLENNSIAKRIRLLGREPYYDHP